MKKNYSLVGLAIAALLFNGPGQPDALIQVDGIISGEEWKNAREFRLSGEGRVMLKKEKDTLFVAIKGNQKGWAHVYLAQNDTVRVMHASAALGQAKYVKQGNVWRSLNAFQWQLRESAYNADLVRKQEEHFRQYGWVANNNNMGDGMSFEFKLAISEARDRSLAFACALALIPSGIYYFPLSLNDNSILPRLVQGYTPDSLHFDPGLWEKIR